MTGSPSKTINRLYASFAIAIVVTVLELVGGLLSRSLALIGDSGHVATDAISLAVAALAIRVAARPHTTTFTYGYHRAEVLAAFINGATLLSVSGYLFFEAYQRLSSTTQVRGPLLIAVAFIGLLANLAMVSLLREGGKLSLNVKGVFLHVVGDALSSASALIAGIVIVATGFFYADSIASVFIGALMLRNTYTLMRDSVAILMERSPPGINSDDIATELMKIDGVRSVHELHVWRLASGFDAMSAHLIVDAHTQDHRVLEEANRVLLEKFRIRHTTIQIGHEDASAISIQGPPPE